MINIHAARSILVFPERLPSFLDEMEAMPAAELDTLSPLVFDVIAMKDRSLSLMVLGRILAMRPDWIDLPEDLGFRVTPLIRAVKNGCLNTVNLLLDAGAQVHAVDTRRQNALNYATRQDFDSAKLARICEALLEKGEFTQEQKDLALYSAADSGSLAAVKVLLAHGADFIKDSQKETALSAACILSKPGAPVLEIVRAMLQTDRGREVIDWGWELHSECHGAPLHCAAYRGDVEVLSLLVDAGAHVNPKPDRPQTTRGTPLMMAATGARLDAVSFLVATGADATLADAIGHNALHYLASNQNNKRGREEPETMLIKVAEVLLAAGADPFKEGYKAMTPQETAIKNENFLLANYLQAITSANRLSSATPSPDVQTRATPGPRL